MNIPSTSADNESNTSAKVTRKRRQQWLMCLHNATGKKSLLKLLKGCSLIGATAASGSHCPTVGTRICLLDDWEITRKRLITCKGLRSLLQLRQNAVALAPAPDHPALVFNLQISQKLAGGQPRSMPATTVTAKAQQMPQNITLIWIMLPILWNASHWNKGTKIRT